MLAATKKATKRAAKSAPKKAAPKTPTKRAKLGAHEYAPLAPYLKVAGAKQAVDFYKRAFGAKVRMIMEAEDKKRLMHADLIINGGELMKTSTVSVRLQVDDADKWWARAVEAGCKVAMPLADQF